MNHVRGKGGMLLGALVYSALATGAFSGAPVANATCVSAFGINNGNGCTSNPTSFAIGIGAGAVANASLGFFGGALAIGTNASAANAVSSFMTPSIAALLGRWFWWPQIVRPRPASQMLRDTPPRPVVRDVLRRDEDRDDAVTIELSRSRVP